MRILNLYFPILNPASATLRALCVLCGLISAAGCDALAWNARQSRETALLDALHSASVEARVAALDDWRVAEHGSLPDDVAKMVLDNHPHVRRAAVAAMAANRHPQATKVIAAALADPDIDVRLAAIAGLAQLGGPDTRDLLEPMLDEPGEKVRAAAAEMLVRLGDTEARARALADKAWQVRLAVAAALADDPSGKAVDEAKQLVADRSAEVQKQIVKSVEKWPVDCAVPVLLLAIESDVYLTSREAARQLAARWPPAAHFPVEPPRDPNPERQALLKKERARAVSALRWQWEQQFGAKIQRASDSIAHAAVAVPLTFDELQRISRMMTDLGSRDVGARRRAAQELAQLAQGRALPAATVEMLARVAIAEPDPLVWQSVLAAVAMDASEHAEQLVLAAASHPAADVRRRACQWLEKHPDSRHATVLTALLADSQSAVTVAAIRALASGERPSDTRPLVQLLASREISVRLEAASALARFGIEEGRDALVRLAHDADASLRRQAALAMGASRDASFLPVLLTLLDDPRTPVQQAAVAALVQLVGEDHGRLVTGQTASITEQVRRWKEWGRPR